MSASNDTATATTNQNKPNLPYTISVLDAPFNGKVYLIGTAHFSLESQKEVAELIQRVQPNKVVLELCSSRTSILKLDEQVLLKEAKEMDTNRIIEIIKQTSVVQGLLQVLLIRLYAKVTEELGLAPGGEFRVAYNEALKIPGCQVELGDMPIKLTLKRGFSSLPWYRKLKLAWCLLTSNHKLTQEDIEELKKSDMLDAMLKEFGSSFPEFKRVLIDERDMYLTHSLRSAYQPIPNQFVEGGFVGAKVVGVIGLGHMAGIKENWNKNFNIDELLKKPEPIKRSTKKGYTRFMQYSILIGTVSIIGYHLFKR